MTVRQARRKKWLASLLWPLIVGCNLSGCGGFGLRAVAPRNAPPDISHRMPRDDEVVHQGVSIGGRGYSGHEIVAPAGGVVVLSRDRHIRINHGADSNGQIIHTDHFHVDGRLLNAGEKVERGQRIGVIGLGKYSALPHYHYVVTKLESPKKLIALNPIDYWFGIDQYKQELEKGLDPGLFVIPCFDPKVNYPAAPIRFTYPVKCKVTTVAAN